MPTVDQITERFAESMAKANLLTAGQSCLNCRHSRKTKATLPGQMVCQLDDSTVDTKASCIRWSALFRNGAV
jgi:hypothetical protein